MAFYDASNPKHLRKALKEAAAQEAQDAGVLQNIMSSPAGRTWMHNLFLECHVFATSWNDVAIKMAFNEGERNIGLKIFLAVVKHCPEPYLQMMREANERPTSTDDDGRGGPGQDSGSDPSGAVESDYDPAAPDE